MSKRTATLFAATAVALLALTGCAPASDANPIAACDTEAGGTADQLIAELRDADESDKPALVDNLNEHTVCVLVAAVSE